MRISRGACYLLNDGNYAEVEAVLYRGVQWVHYWLYNKKGKPIPRTALNVDTLKHFKTLVVVRVQRPVNKPIMRSKYWK